METLREQIERDAHGNVQLSGGDLGVAVQGALGEAFPKVRVRVDTFGYLPRGFATMASDVDRREAFDAGAFAAATAAEGSCSVGLQFDGAKTVFRRVPLGNVAGKTRLMPDDFMNGRELSAKGKAYFDRLVPAAPDHLPSLL
jgi:6-phosphofructokinase 1